MEEYFIYTCFVTATYESWLNLPSFFTGANEIKLCPVYPYLHVIILCNHVTNSDSLGTETVTIDISNVNVLTMFCEFKVV